MESKNLDKAIEIYSKLISGEEICKKHPDNGPLYDEFYGNAEVYDIVMNMMKKMNLSLYEYNDSLYITAGEGNRVFGYTNDDMKKLLYKTCKSLCSAKTRCDTKTNLWLTEYCVL